MTKHSLVALAIASLMTPVTACGGGSGTSSGQSKADDLTLATFSGEVYGLDVIAQKQGFFQKRNLNVSFISPQSGGAAAVLSTSAFVRSWSCCIRRTLDSRPYIVEPPS